MKKIKILFVTLLSQILFVTCGPTETTFEGNGISNDKLCCHFGPDLKNAFQTELDKKFPHRHWYCCSVPELDESQPRMYGEIIVKNFNTPGRDKDYFKWNPYKRGWTYVNYEKLTKNMIITDFGRKHILGKKYRAINVQDSGSSYSLDILIPVSKVVNLEPKPVYSIVEIPDRDVISTKKLGLLDFTDGVTEAVIAHSDSTAILYLYSKEKMIHIKEQAKMKLQEYNINLQERRKKAFEAM